MEKSKIIKELTKKDLFDSFIKDSYGSQIPKCSAKKHSCYKRSLVKNTLINKETQKAALRVKQCPRFITEI